MPEPVAVPIAKVEPIIGVSEKTVRRAEEAGEIQLVRIGGRTLVMVEELRRWLVSRRGAAA